MKVYQLLATLEKMIGEGRCLPDATVRIRQKGREEENIAILRDKDGTEVLLETWE